MSMCTCTQHISTCTHLFLLSVLGLQLYKTNCMYKTIICIHNSGVTQMTEIRCSLFLRRYCIQEVSKSSVYHFMLRGKK